MPFNIYHDLSIKANPLEIFEAISSPERLVNWWPNRCSGTPEKDCIYNFYFSSEYDWYGKVVRSEPGKSFHIQMTVSDKDWNPTSFGFDLIPVDNGTRLEFWHINWPACNAHFRRSSYCWAILLQNLKNYLEKGIIIPFEQRE